MTWRQGRPASGKWSIWSMALTSRSPMALSQKTGARKEDFRVMTALCSRADTTIRAAMSNDALVAAVNCFRATVCRTKTGSSRRGVTDGSLHSDGRECLGGLDETIGETGYGSGLRVAARNVRVGTRNAMPSGFVESAGLHDGLFPYRHLVDDRYGLCRRACRWRLRRIALTARGEASGQAESSRESAEGDTHRLTVGALCRD
jgi:hypothetical protein